MSATLSGVQLFKQHIHSQNNSKRVLTRDSDLGFVHDILVPDLILLAIGLSAVFGLLLSLFQ